MSTFITKIIILKSSKGKHSCCDVNYKIMDFSFMIIYCNEKKNNRRFKVFFL